MPMLWGLIPSWHRGSIGEKSYETNNCRAEGMLEKKTYKVPLQKGHRCVVLAEGFFEWKRDKNVKQPYYIYFPHVQNKSNRDSLSDKKVKVEGHFEVKVEPDSVICETGNVQHSDNRVKLEEMDFEKEESQLPRLLTMAGVFDVWTPPGESEPLYSYSVITVDSSPALSWLHDRMPAILTSDEEIEQWLNFEDIPLNKAVSCIRPVTCIESHPVSTVVNNSRNNTAECVKMIDLSKPKKCAASTFMSSWLAKGQKVKTECDVTGEGQKVKSEEPVTKKHKIG